MWQEDALTLLAYHTKMSQLAGPGGKGKQGWRISDTAREAGLTVTRTFYLLKAAKHLIQHGGDSLTSVSKVRF